MQKLSGISKLIASLPDKELYKFIRASDVNMVQSIWDRLTKQAKDKYLSGWSTEAQEMFKQDMLKIGPQTYTNAEKIKNIIILGRILDAIKE